MKNLLRISSLSLVLVCSLISCTKDFEKINVNPNSPTTVQPSFLLPNIIKNVSNRLVEEGWSIGNIVVQHTAKIQFVNEDRYLWGERNNIWNTFYENLGDVKNIIDNAQSTGQKNYQAVGLIMKSYMFSVLTDCYGDIPYTEAISGKEGISFAVYDKQEDIYTGILKDLETANNLLGTSTEVVNGDILYSGNLQRWKKFSNSLRVRLLMRLSDRKPEFTKLELAKILGDSQKYPLFESNNDNASLTYLPASPNQFPPHTYRVGSYHEYRISKTLVDQLSAWKDPRLAVLARPTDVTISGSSKVYTGVPNGMEDVAALLYAGGPQNISKVGTLFYEDAIKPAGLSVAKGVFMTASELQFLLAEARVKNFISTGNAEQYYKDGVTASFQYYGVSVPADYFSSPSTAYQEGDALERIGKQKWTALFFNGMEAWIDWRRTNIPKIVPGPANLNGNRVPVRYIYPAAEQSLNGPNRTQAVTRQGGDNHNTKVWWDVNDNTF